MRRIGLILLAAAMLAGCGLREPLQPPPGASLPVAPVGARDAPPTAEALLAHAADHPPARVDEIVRRSELREEDRFDLPPPEVPAGVVPIPVENGEPQGGGPRMMKPVRTAVFPVAGLGTRILPATKAMPKEMLTIVDRPLIQYAVEEALEAGVERFVFVTGRGKSALVDHFDIAYELEATMTSRGKSLEPLGGTRFQPGALVSVRQQEPLGLGHAVWCAREIVGDEPFAVLLPDDLMVGAGLPRPDGRGL